MMAAPLKALICCDHAYAAEGAQLKHNLEAWLLTGGSWHLFFRPVRLLTPAPGQVSPDDQQRVLIGSTSALVLYYDSSVGASAWNEACAASFSSKSGPLIFVSDTSGSKRSYAPRYGEMAAFTGVEPFFVDLAEGKTAIRRIVATATGKSYQQLKGRLVAQGAGHAISSLGRGLAAMVLAVLALAAIGAAAIRTMSTAFTNEIDPRPDTDFANAICTEMTVIKARSDSAMSADSRLASDTSRAVAKGEAPCAAVAVLNSGGPR